MNSQNILPHFHDPDRLDKLTQFSSKCVEVPQGFSESAKDIKAEKIYLLLANRTLIMSDKFFAIPFRSPLHILRDFPSYLKLTVCNLPLSKRS